MGNMKIVSKAACAEGHKIGLTSSDAGQFPQISEPDYGALLDDMFFHNGGDIPVTALSFPRIEVELAFVLAKTAARPELQ